MREITLDRTSRILVIGTSGSGKTTLAEKLSARLGIKNIELDALFWKENWTQSTTEEFRGNISDSIKDSIKEARGYVLHGNYNKVQDLTWGNVDTVIWLDYSRAIVMWRVVKRTIGRILSKEELWAGNRETFKKSFLKKDSIILWAWNTYGKRKTQYSMMVKENPYKVSKFIIMKRPKDANRFLKGIELAIEEKGRGRS